MSTAPLRKKPSSVINLSKTLPEGERLVPLGALIAREMQIAADRNAYVNLAADAASRIVLSQLRTEETPSSAMRMTAAALFAQSTSLREAADMIEKRAVIAYERAEAAAAPIVSTTAPDVNLTSVSITERGA